MARAAVRSCPGVISRQAFTEVNVAPPCMAMQRLITQRPHVVTLGSAAKPVLLDHNKVTQLINPQPPSPHVGLISCDIPWSAINAVAVFKTVTHAL